jgi:hypothetical protein
MLLDEASGFSGFKAAEGGIYFRFGISDFQVFSP